MTQSTLLRALFYFSSMLFIYSCDDDGPPVVQSDTVATGNIFATIQVISDGGEYVFAEAQLTLETPPSETEDPKAYVELVDDDLLWFSTGTNIQDLQFGDNVFDELKVLDGTQSKFKVASTHPEVYDFIFFRAIINPFGNWYSAQLPQTEAREFQVSLFRQRTDQAKYSNVSLPGAYSIVSPDGLDLFSRSTDDIIVEWDNTESGLSVEIALSTQCPDLSFDSYSMVLAEDTGIATIPAGALEENDLIGRCTTTINVRKAKTGQLDQRFIGGAITGYQIRRATITTDD